MKKILLSIMTVILSIMLLSALTACNNTATDEPTDAPHTEAATAASHSVLLPTDASATEGNNTDTHIAGAVPESPAVDASYFDSAAFVGDSVSLKLSYYAAGTGALGKAQFFTAGSLGCGNALWEVSNESVHPSFQGTKMLVEDCILRSGASKVYIMLGMNDIGLYGIDATVENYKTLIGRILAKSPDVQIVVQSMTPMTAESNIMGDTLNNDNIKVYNNLLCEMCTENGWAFVDVASVMYTENGYSLNRAYCSDPDDMGVHFTEEGCQRWVDYLLTHTP
ncbi:MAG: GDSL-type esterase/lipase family protein [Ruminococcus sp.]